MRLSIFCTILFCITYISWRPPVLSLEDGLVAWYTFDDCDATDDSGNGSHGRLFGDVGCWCGIDNDGLLFDGARDYVEFPGYVNRFFTTSDVTISFYFKTSEYSVFKQSMLSKRSVCDEDHMFDIQLDCQNALIDTDFHETEFKDFAGLSPKYDSGGWKHFVLVRKGIRAYTYINGVFQNKSTRCSGVDITNDAVLSFGNSPCVLSGNARRFKGILDELRIYNRALSADEVAALYALHPIETAETDCLTAVPTQIGF